MLRRHQPECYHQKMCQYLKTMNIKSRKWSHTNSCTQCHAWTIHTSLVISGIAQACHNYESKSYTTTKTVQIQLQQCHAEWICTRAQNLAISLQLYTPQDTLSYSMCRKSANLLKCKIYNMLLVTLDKCLVPCLVPYLELFAIYCRLHTQLL